MDRTRLVSMEFFSDFQDKDKFFEKMTSDKDMLGRAVNQYLLLNICTFLYGIAMGSYNGFRQAISSGIKVPLLLSLALLICFPAFFIIQYALGSKLRFCQMFMIILSGFVITGLIMLSFAPIVIFFLITGCNYSFLKLLHVAIFGLSGFFGMKTILDALRFSCEKKNVYPKIGVVVFRFWILILAFVGMQLAWNLRPFIGSRDLPFELLRKREGNFYIAVVQSVGDLFTSSSKKTNNK
jgi:hypothetical protein